MDNQKHIDDIQNKTNELAQTIANLFIASFLPERQFKKSINKTAFGDILYDKSQVEFSKENNELWLDYTQDLFRKDAAIDIRIKPNRKNIEFPVIHFIIQIKHLNNEFFEILEEIFILADRTTEQIDNGGDVDPQVRIKSMKEMYAKILQIPETIEKAF